MISQICLKGGNGKNKLIQIIMGYLVIASCGQRGSRELQSPWESFNSNPSLTINFSEMPKNPAVSLKGDMSMSGTYRFLFFVLILRFFLHAGHRLVSGCSLQIFRRPVSQATNPLTHHHSCFRIINGTNTFTHFKKLLLQILRPLANPKPRMKETTDMKRAILSAVFLLTR